MLSVEALFEFTRLNPSTMHSVATLSEDVGSRICTKENINFSKPKLLSLRSVCIPVLL